MNENDSGKTPTFIDWQRIGAHAHAVMEQTMVESLLGQKLRRESDYQITSEGRNLQIEAHVLTKRKEKYYSPAGDKEESYLERRLLPEKVCLLTASADTQHNRLEAQIMGWGPGEECWLLAHEIFWGNPGIATDPTTGVDVWAALDEFLLRS